MARLRLFKSAGISRKYEEFLPIHKRSENIPLSNLQLRTFQKIRHRMTSSDNESESGSESEDEIDFDALGIKPRDQVCHHIHILVH